ncbi:MAG: GNAT family N-acetyltransferase [Chloroflexales bacterium]|nr:GNAT family N-acetyltransferase [Chloroflexales bacterium]
MLDLTAAFAAFPVLETERLVLRAVTPDDANAMFRIMSDPRVVRYFGVPPMKAPQEATERIANMLASFAEQSGVRWAITRRGSTELLGTCGFWRLIKPHFRAEIGYELAPKAWGQGIIPEAAGAALAFGFTTMGLHSVEAQIDPANSGSRRVLEKLGFVQEGYFRENYYQADEARFTDTAVFSLLRAAWMGGLGV